MVLRTSASDCPESSVVSPRMSSHCPRYPRKALTSPATRTRRKPRAKSRTCPDCPSRTPSVITATTMVPAAASCPRPSSMPHPTGTLP